MNDFNTANEALVDFVRLYKLFNADDPTSARTKNLRRLCKSQITAVKRSLSELLGEEIDDESPK